jgi:ferredoxin
VAERAGVSPDDVIRVTRLCDRALQTGDPELFRVFDRDVDFVAGCSRPRAARALLDLAGVAHRGAARRWLALPFDREALKSEIGVPWYPVIDRDLCTGCGTCAEYCLFSVYRQEPRAAGWRARARRRAAQLQDRFARHARGSVPKAH